MSRTQGRTPSSDGLALFAVGLTLPLALALNGGGLDSVVRQQASLGLWWTAAVALVFGVIPRSRPGSLRIAFLGLAALTAWTAASLTWTESDERTFAEVGRVVGYAGLVVVAGFAVNRDNWRPAAAGLCLAVLFVPFIAVASRLAPDWFETGFDVELDRLAYPLEYWNALASWSAMAVTIGLALSSHLERKAYRALALAAVPAAGSAIYLTYSRGGLVVAVLGVGAVLVMARHRATLLIHAAAAVVGIALVILVIRSQPEIAEGTGSGGAWLVALALVAACLACAYVARRPRRRRRRTTEHPWTRGPSSQLATRLFCAGGLLTVLAAGVAWGPGIAAAARDEFTSSGYPAVGDDGAGRLKSLEGSRDEVWGSALDAFGSDPLTGIGAGTFEYWYAHDVPEGERVRDAHSLPIETLAELGVPGLLMLALFLGGVAVAAVRGVGASGSSSDLGMRAGLAGAFIVFVFHSGIDWMWESTAVGAVAILVGSVAASSTNPVRSAGMRRATARHYGLGLLAVAAGVVQIPAIVSTERIRAGVASAEIGREDDAFDSADEAVTAQPWAASPYALRSLVNLAAGRVPEALDDARDAIEREPTNWRHRVLLARVLDTVGDADGVGRALAIARKLGAPAAPVPPAP